MTRRRGSCRADPATFGSTPKGVRGFAVSWKPLANQLHHSPALRTIEDAP